MRRGSFGVLVLIVVVVIVLVLAAKNWQSVKQAGPAAATGDVRSLPGMKNMKSATDLHAKEVGAALGENESDSSSDDASQQ
ncbi:MAG: hypothetical protein U0V87_15470 [Acidobacteriota bacterium]